VEAPESFDDDHEAVLREAAITLRFWTRGDLRHDELTTPIRFAPAGDGRLIASVTAGMLAAGDCAMAVPDEHAPAMELTVTLEEFQPTGPAEAHADRWRIYHGDPPNSRWAMMSPDAARFRGEIIDGAVLQHSNPLSSVEPRLCGLLNRSHQDEIRTLMKRELDLDADNPKVVGIDPLGLDIRNRFDVVRIGLATSATDPATAEAVVIAAIRSE
jgi:hypothetical protein